MPANTKFDYGFYKIGSPSDVLKAYLETHDNLYDKTRVYETKRFLRKHLLLDSLNILEIGCGGGLWSAFFAKEAASITCSDIRPHVIEAAKLFVAREASEERAEQVNWHTGDITQNSPEDWYDFVFLKDVVEHVEDDVALMHSIASLLKPGGFLYIATQNSWSLNNLIEGGYNKLRGNTAWCGWDPTHLRIYNPITLRALISKSGFRAIAWHGMYHIPYRFVSRLLLKKVIEHKALHLFERLFGQTWPISLTGWSIGTMLQFTAREI